MSSSVRSYYSDDSFKQFVMVSLVLHFSFLIFFAVKNLLLPTMTIEIPHSIRVDVVALPDKIDPEVRPLTAQKKDSPAPITPQPEAKKVDLKKEEPINLKESQKKALDKIKAMDALEKIKSEVSAKAAQPKELPASQTFKGNIISSGNDFTGLSKLRVNEYLDNLMAKIRQHWELPQWLTGANLKATVIIQIDERGYIIKNEIHVSSGHRVFDSLCIDAVKNSSPVEQPPDEVKNALITIRFPFE